jgi:acetyl-CoA decarbonylase/synthase complex subunit epsilon
VNKVEPWQKAEIPGPEKALVITKSEVVVSLINSAKNPILIVGHEATNKQFGEETEIDYLVRLANITKIKVVATAHVVKDFLKIGFQPAAWMPLVDIANRLQDQNWKGLDNKGKHDLALFIGLPYYMEWIILSSLKNFSSTIKTISLDRFYQPNASWSFPNISYNDWKNNLKAVEEKLKLKKR